MSFILQIKNLFNHLKYIFYFFAVAAINSGIIIIKLNGIDGLNNQYNIPNEKINIQNSFFFKIFM